MMMRGLPCLLLLVASAHAAPKKKSRKIEFNTETSATPTASPTTPEPTTRAPTPAPTASKTGVETLAGVQASRWREDLLFGVGFGLESLAPKSALATSQLTESGWLATHESWWRSVSRCGGADRPGATPGSEGTSKEAATRHPVCVGDIDVVTGGPCGDVLCDVEGAWSGDLPSPFYLPPATYLTAPLAVGEARACSVPADQKKLLHMVNPLNGLNYGIGSLKLAGTVVSSTGEKVDNALVEIWHAEPFGRIKGGDASVSTPLADLLGESEDALSWGQDEGCRAALWSDSEGAVVVETVDPGNYGPPQHVEIRVSRSGFETVVTKIYLGDDPVFTETPDLAANLASLRLDQRILFPTYGEPSPDSNGTLAFTSRGLNRTLTFEVVLQPANADASLYEGTWSSPNGLVEVASSGSTLLAREVPTPRTWGAVTARHLVGGYSLDADFFRGSTTSRGSLVLKTSSGENDFIEWSHGEVWKMLERRLLPYRYLRIYMNETLRTRDGGVVQLHEVRVHEQVLTEGRVTPLDGVRLLEHHAVGDGPRCWATTKSEDCWRVFDGDPASFWKSDEVGGMRGKLSKPQHLTLDLGKAQTLWPTALSLSCGAIVQDGQRSMANCPRYFELRAAREGADPENDASYETLYAHRVRVVDGEPDETFADGAGFFEFALGTFAYGGREVGARCGSSAGASDASCASGWCGDAGRCVSERPACTPGTYQQDTGCLNCPGGKYGGGLEINDCRQCEEGFYCPEASISPIPCTNEGEHCPEGSAAPIQTAAAYYEENGQQILCPVGHFCSRGRKQVCPRGFFGNETGLASEGCSGPCDSHGEHCPEASVTPVKCPRGSYCPGSHGLVVACPPGRFGRFRGLGGAGCTGICEAGYYCPASSTSPRESPCPGGRYGNEAGLGSPDCTGECAPGHFCPAPSTSRTQFPCVAAVSTTTGTYAAYCPAGSGAALPVSAGYYADGGVDDFSRDKQTQCEPGFGCSRGRRYVCAAGTYRTGPTLVNLQVYFREGDSDDDTQVETADCGLACPAGHYCPQQTLNPLPCPAGTYSSFKGSSSCDDTPCPRGSYCPPGAASPTKCPAGRFGSTTGLATSACSKDCHPRGNDDGPTACAASACDPGYYCPEGSTHARQRECGEGFYCPLGSKEPVRPMPGYVAVGGGSPTTHTDQEEAPTAESEEL